MPEKYKSKKHKIRLKINILLGIIFFELAIIIFLVFLLQK